MNRAILRLSAAAVLASVILVGCGGGGGGLSDPGLSNVQVEVGNARSAVVGPEGGAITATGSNGFVYKLTFPAGSVLQPTNIALYPVKAIKNLPQGQTVSGGVNFAPDGLQLVIPATLTIQVPSGIDAKTLFTIGYDGNADKLHPSLGTVTGQTITEPVHHFSGTALGSRTVADLVSQGLPFANDARSFQRRMADALRNSQTSNISPRADYLLILRNWYDLIVRPKLISSAQSGVDRDRVAVGVQEYQVWLDAILYAKLTLNDPAFSVSPELGESEPLAVAVLHRWYQVYNDLCVANKNNDINQGFFENPLEDAELAMAAGELADQWQIARNPNALDKETLLNSLCVKVVIENKNYTGSAPNDVGDLTVKAGFTIAGGPPRHDYPIKVKISGNGLPLVGGGIVNNGDLYHDSVQWPPSVNPLVIDILASLFEAKFNSLKDIAVFDRITKGAQGPRIAFSSGGGSDFDIYTMDGDGSHQTRLTSSPDSDGQPAISPDGTKIAFHRHHSINNTVDDAILVMNVDGSNQVSLTNSHDLKPTWSPDGKKIAFESHRDGTAAIYVMNADGSNQKRITFNGSKSFDGDFEPSWSPDGTRIAFASSSGSPFGIVTIRPDGSNQQKLTNGTQDRSPAWSPDGTKITFQSNRDVPGDIYVMNADGSNQTRLTHGERSSDYPSWSPDGAKIAFHSHPSEPIDGIFVIGAGGGNPTLIANPGRQPSFGRKP